MENPLDLVANLGARRDSRIHQLTGLFNTALQNLGCLHNLRDRCCTDADSPRDVGDATGEPIFGAWRAFYVWKAVWCIRAE